MKCNATNRGMHWEIGDCCAAAAAAGALGLCDGGVMDEGRGSILILQWKVFITPTDDDYFTRFCPLPLPLPTKSKIQLELSERDASYVIFHLVNAIADSSFLFYIN